MRRITQLDPEDSRIGGFAALLTLGGHAVVIVTALVLSSRTVSQPEQLNMVSVTLVSAADAHPAKAASSRASRTSAQAPLAAPAPKPFQPSGEVLDRLSSSDPEPAPSDGPSGQASASGGAKPGEGVAGIDLYAVAGLPPVGQRPSVSPEGSLWRKVAPCWRPSAGRAVTLAIEIQEGGNLGTAVQAIRRPGRPSDPATLEAERSALRAIQACAPYPGIAAQRWRIDFPAVRQGQFEN